jgi:hypothetical protein
MLQVFQICIIYVQNWRARELLKYILLGIQNKKKQLSNRRQVMFGVMVMVFNATFNNDSVISCHGSGQFYWVNWNTGENHRPAASHWQNLSHNVESSTHRLSGIRTHNVNGDRNWLHSLLSIWTFGTLHFLSEIPRNI